MLTVPTTRPVVIGPAGLSGELALCADARLVALIVHPDRASRCEAGHRFVVDVLGANGVACLSIGLRNPREEARRSSVRNADVVAARLRSALAWLARHAATSGLPVGLVAVDAAVPACLAAGGLPGLDAVCAMVMFDGQPALSPDAVAAWRWPALAIAGRNEKRLRSKGLGRRKVLAAPHRLVRLALQTQPISSAGAYEAMACEATAWLLAALPALAAVPATGSRAARPARRACSALQGRDPVTMAAPRAGFRGH